MGLGNSVTPALYIMKHVWSLQNILRIAQGK